MALPKIAYPMIRKKMKEAEESAKHISKLLDFSYTTCLHKLAGKRSFTVEEGIALAQHYGASVENMFRKA